MKWSFQEAETITVRTSPRKSVVRSENDFMFSINGLTTEYEPMMLIFPIYIVKLLFVFIKTDSDLTI